MATGDEEVQLRQVALQNAQAILHARRRSEEELRSQSELLRVTLASIGDAVVSTDADGRVSLMNGVAEQLTGWSQPDALGHPIQNILVIVDEHTRQPVENPALRALQEGTIVALEDHSVLIARHGGECPIDDRAAPIRSADGALLGAVLTFRDIGARRRSEALVRQSQAESDRQRRLYEAILTNTPDLAYVFDRAHRFVYANDGLLKLWGRTWDEAIGKTCLELGYEPWHASLHGREIDHIVATRESVRGEVPFTGIYGPRIYEYILVPVLSADGDVEAVAGTTRDVTDRKRAALEHEGLLARERAAREEAERASVTREEFLAMLSHELRTPLSAIVGWTHVLRSRTPTPEILGQGLSVIDRNARMQVQLIAELLDMSRIMSGTMQIETERIDLAAVVDAAIESVRTSAEEKGITIVPVLRPVAMTGDPVRLQQVAWNLLANAIKFTPSGGSVHVTLTPNEHQVVLIVRDTGLGIAPEFLPHVFERFRQADNTAAREHGGLGLGLAIVKQLVELHGGAVHVTSAGEGRGSTFTVELPLDACEVGAKSRRTQPTAEAVSPLLTASPDLTGISVLLVDDAPDTRDLITLVLGECGAHVLAARSAQEALVLLDGESPDVILSDIGMPLVDGYTFIDLVRRRGITIPAAALTAFVHHEDRRRALNAGFQRFVPKPLEPDELLATVAALVNRSAPDDRPEGVASGRGGRSQ